MRRSALPVVISLLIGAGSASADEKAIADFYGEWRGIDARGQGGVEPTGKPGVFAYREEPGSMLQRLFASPTTSNPLEGETLLWARLAGPTLTVYSLALEDDGGFRLDRHERTLQEGSMSYVGSRRTGQGPTVIAEGRLQPEPG
jgi:hypothetical protein